MPFRTLRGLAVALLIAVPLACSNAAPDEVAGSESELTNVGFDESSLSLDLDSTETVKVMAVNGGSAGYIAVRAGSHKTITLGASDVWLKLHPGTRVPDASAGERDPAKRAQADARLRELAASVVAIYRRDGSEIGRQTVRTTSARSYSYSYNLNAVLLDTDPIAIPANADEILLSVELSDAADASARVVIPESKLGRILVLGGHADRKNAMFINTIERGRVEQILEGGALPKGGKVTLQFARARAEALVDYARLDRYIGTEVHPRGPRIPIFGDVAFDIVGAYRFDDGSEWHNFTLARDPNGLVAGEWYSVDVNTPSNATKMEVFFEVKAALVVDYSRHGTVADQRYVQGDRIALGNKFDNKDSVPGRNYVLSLK